MSEHAHEPVAVRLYGIIGGVLVIGTILAFVFADALELGWLPTIFLIFGIATFKALLVALYFMHLRFEGRWKFVLTIPPFFLFTALLLALVPDIARFGSYSV